MSYVTGIDGFVFWLIVWLRCGVFALPESVLCKLAFNAAGTTPFGDIFFWFRLR